MSDNNGYTKVIRSLWNRLLGVSHNGKRDRYEVFGWDKDISIQSLKSMYQRNMIAGRIVRIFPQYTWAEAPDVHDESKTSETEPGSFSLAWDELNTNLSVLRYMKRADRLASIGQYGLLLMGFADGKNPFDSLVGKAPLVYLAAYSEDSITVSERDQDTQSPRYGLPTYYTIAPKRANNNTGAELKSIRVHHSRCIHISENTDEDETYGLPRLLGAYNHLSDLEKVLGSSAENFWLSANRGVLWSAAAGAEFDDDDFNKMQEQADEYAHELRRHVVGSNLNATVLGSDAPDPSKTLDKLVALIAGHYGIPVRLLLGSERGELASTQDRDNWQAQIDERQTNFAAPDILLPFVNKMIETGNLPEPQGKLTATWNPVDNQSPKDKAEINKSRAESLASYVNSTGADAVVSPQEFRSEFLNLPEVSTYNDTLTKDDLEDLDLDENDPDVKAVFEGR